MWIEAGVITAILLLFFLAALLTLRHIAIILERRQNARRRILLALEDYNARRRMMRDPNPEIRPPAERPGCKAGNLPCTTPAPDARGAAPGVGFIRSGS